MIFDVEFSHARHQAFAIRLTMVSNEIWVRGAEHDIDRIRAAFQDQRHRIDHDFDALVGTKQPECQNDRLPAKSELGLCRIGPDKGDVGDTVGNDLDLVVRHLVDASQQLAALLGHHHDFRRYLGDAHHDRALHNRRLGQHGVERGHHGHGETQQQHEDVGAGVAAENSELVLQAYGIEPASIEKVRSAQIVFEVVVPDLQSDRGGVIVSLTVIGHRHDAGLRFRTRIRDRLLQVCGEGGNPAAARKRIADESDTADGCHGCIVMAVSRCCSMDADQRPSMACGQAARRHVRWP